MEPLRPPRVTALQAARKGVRALWHGRQMNVMRHQAPAKQPDSVAGAVLGQRLQLLPPVFTGHEDILSMIAPLGNLMRNAHRDHTGRPRHKCGPLSHPAI